MNVYKKEKIGMGFLLVWFICFFVMALKMPRLETRVWPLFVEGMGIILTTIHLGVVIYKEKHDIPIDTPAPLSKDKLITVAKAMLFFIFYAVSAYYIGFITMTFICGVLFSFWLFPKDKKWKYFVFSGVMALVVYLFFVAFLAIPLPRGFLI